jgi:hypothetical protein
LPQRSPTGPDRPTTRRAALGAIDDFARVLGKYTVARQTDIRETTRALRSNVRGKPKR